MIPFVWRWLAPHLYLVTRCPECTRADVAIRFPERFAYCERCGGLVLASRT